MQPISKNYIKFLKLRYFLFKVSALGLVGSRQKLPKFNIGDKVTGLVDSYFLRTNKTYTVYSMCPNKSFSWTVALNETMALVDERELIKINE